MSRVCLLLVSLMFASSAGAIQVVPSSYSMPNGVVGANSYLDDTYSGAGCRTCAGSALSGGLGDLVDGVIATANWDTQAIRYVGWTSNPTVNFSFPVGAVINSVTFYFDDAGGYGGVRAPSSVSIAGQSYSVVDPSPGSSAPFAFTVNGLNISIPEVPIAFSRSGGSGAFMLSEVSFDGVVSAVPEPSQWIILLLGLAGLIASRRVRAI